MTLDEDSTTVLVVSAAITLLNVLFIASVFLYMCCYTEASAVKQAAVAAAMASVRRKTKQNQSSDDEDQSEVSACMATTPKFDQCESRI